MTPPRLDEGSEREAFEAEIRKDAGDLSTFGSGANLHYRNSAVNNAWGGWKARAALAAEPSLRAAGFTVLEGFTLPHDVRKILETAYYTGEDCALMSTPEVQMADAALSTGRLGGEAPAARDVLAERARQINAEGWTPQHDDEHSDGRMAVAAAYYAMYDAPGWGRVIWPWDEDWRKPKDARSNLVRAGALILAEIERLDRAAPAAKHQGDSNAQ